MYKFNGGRLFFVGTNEGISLVRVVANCLYSLFCNCVKNILDSVLTDAPQLDQIVQGAMGSVLSVYDLPRNVYQSFFSGRSKKTRKSDEDGLQQIVSLLGDRIDGLRLGNVRQALDRLADLTDVGEDGGILSQLADLRRFTTTIRKFDFQNIRDLTMLGRRIKKITKQNTLSNLMREIGFEQIGTTLRKLASLSDLEDLLNIRIILRPVIKISLVVIVTNTILANLLCDFVVMVISSKDIKL